MSEEEDRYRADYLAGEPYALKRAAKASATIFVLGICGFFLGLPERYPDSDLPFWYVLCGGVTALGGYALLDCVRRFRRARSSGPA